jgi:hypothetical protein
MVSLTPSWALEDGFPSRNRESEGHQWFRLLSSLTRRFLLRPALVRLVSRNLRDLQLGALSSASEMWEHAGTGNGWTNKLTPVPPCLSTKACCRSPYCRNGARIFPQCFPGPALWLPTGAGTGRQPTEPNEVPLAKSPRGSPCAAGALLQRYRR